MISILLLALAAQGTAHADLHPSGADYYVESPDIQAVLAAYPTAPMAKMFADAEALGALRGMLGDEALTGTSLLNEALGLLGVEGVYASDVDQVRAASLSLRGRLDEAPPRVLGIVDAVSEEVAIEIVDLGAGALAGSDFWIERMGARVVAGRGITFDAWKTLVGGEGMTLGAQQAFSSEAVLLDPANGPVLLRGFQRRNVFHVLEEITGGELGPLPGIWGFLLGNETTHFQMALEGGRFVSQAYSPATPSPIASAPWIAPGPVNLELLSEVHPGCLFVAASSFDKTGFRDAVGKLLGADLSNEPLFDKLGRSGVLFVQPVKGIGLPKTYVMLDLDEPAGALDDLVALTETLSGSGVTAKQRKYKKVPYVTITLPDDVGSLGDLGSVRPVATVFGDKLFVTNGTLALKSEIRRRQGEERDQLGPANYPWTRGEQVFGDGATAVMYVNWAAQVDGLFSLAKSFGGMLKSMAPDMPFDLTNLPDSSLFTRHMPPTLHTVTQRAGNVHHHHVAGFAFETWAGLVGLGSKVMQALDPEPPVLEPAPVDPTRSEDAVTRTAMRDVRAALTVYKIDQGLFPDSLQKLVEPSENYPLGYVTGEMVDGWGNPFRYQLTQGGTAYRIWSKGADGIDQNGAGDDVSP